MAKLIVFTVLFREENFAIFHLDSIVVSKSVIVAITLSIGCPIIVFNDPHFEIFVAVLPIFPGHLLKLSLKFFHNLLLERFKVDVLSYLKPVKRLKPKLSFVRHYCVFDSSDLSSFRFRLRRAFLLDLLYLLRFKSRF